MPLLESAKKRECRVFFVDAAHFVMGSFLGRLWSKARVFIPSSSGRKRYNVLGAIDTIDHQTISECNETYINADSVCNLLRTIRNTVGRNTVSENESCIIPITLVMDNARYQRCEPVRLLSDEMEITLLFLPSYSPNLNLIERVWRWVKSDCLNCKYHETFGEFKDAINQSIMKVSQVENKKEFDKLLALNFQLFDDVIYDRR